MERNQGHRFLNPKEASWNFDLSDIKNDKTQYLDRTELRSVQNSPFEPKEISARSTQIQTKQKFGQLDFDEIMKSSSSEAVRNKYRESLAVGRMSNFPKTNDSSFRSSISNKNSEIVRTTSTVSRKDFWDDANPSFSSFTGKNLTYSNEEFTPAENMAFQLEEDEKMQEMEYAVIPRVNKATEETGNWENNVSRQPEMSFGQYCMEKIKQSNIREVYSNVSPPKRQDRIPLVELSTNDSSIMMNELQKDGKFDQNYIEKLIKKSDANKAPKALMNKLMEKKVKEVQKNVAELFSDQKNSNTFPSSVARMMQELDVDRIMELAEEEKSRMRMEKEMDTFDDIPVQDENNYGDDLQRDRNELQTENRGLKRRQSLLSSDTPRSALDKCLRSRSPSNYRELEKAAENLKPKMLNDESIFKKPLPNDSTIHKTYNKSPSRTMTENSDSQQTSREYLTAMQGLSIRSPNEKLSLPNYGLQRPERSALTSPTSSASIRSINTQHWSPEHRLRRSASQLSNDSEFSDDYLPIKINNMDNRKISFPSVKIDKYVIKSITIQNGSDKKLPLRVKVIGAGFSVSPQEEFRMVPMEARTFKVKFLPSIVGPARGSLIFELITNKQCSKTIPLYAYGGHSSISIDGVQKGPFGPQFITMGTVKELHAAIECKIRLVNKGTLPGFASLAFEKTKLSDFVLSDSISVEPKQLRIESGKSADVRIRFKPSKSEVRKIISFNKDVTTIGEICVISGDEPTRLRVLKNQHFVEPKFLNCLPKSLPNEIDIHLKLQKFKEDLSRDKLTSIMEETIRTHGIALTINRDLEDSIMLSTEMSLADDTRMSFKTFLDQTNMPNPMDTVYFDEVPGQDDFLEGKDFRISPSELYFNRSDDDHNTTRFVKIESLSDEIMYIEAVPSNHKLLSAMRSCGKLNPRQSCEIKVSFTDKAYNTRHSVTTVLIIIIHGARIEIPVKLVE
ncbi:unnamed protein product [Chironomus riparius]|uniref:Uncharacterized protein n=1 Tax=Chironomus riparius TaxID=315576 RepID=A0A9N9RSP9_9DIPT|nr:unnamed protein product [Chironomus riparius]